MEGVNDLGLSDFLRACNQGLELSELLFDSLLVLTEAKTDLANLRGHVLEHLLLLVNKLLKGSNFVTALRSSVDLRLDAIVDTASYIRFKRLFCRVLHELRLFRPLYVLFGHLYDLIKFRQCVQRKVGLSNAKRTLQRLLLQHAGLSSDS